MRKSFMSSLRWIAGALALVAGANVANAQIVYSQNFQGESTTTAPVSWTSTYNFVSNTVGNGMNPSQTYSITNNLARNNGDFNNPVTQHPNIQSSEPNIFGQGNPFFDHTFGDNSGLYLALNGGAATSVYRTVNTFGVVANTDYVFSIWMTSWTNAANNFGQLDVQLIGDVSTLASNFVTAPDPGGPSGWGQVWVQRTFAFNSGNNTSFTLDLVNVNTDVNGNDFSVDDISIFAAAVPEPTSIALGSLGAIGLGSAVFAKVRASRRRRVLAKQNTEAVKS